MAYTPREHLAIGRMLLKHDKRAPYLAAAVDALVPVEAPGLGTVGVTEQGVLLWDPVTVCTWSHDEVATVLEHEVWHVLRRHGERCRAGGFDPMLANIAWDCEINDDLVKAGLKL